MLIVGWAFVDAWRLWKIETNEYGNRFLAAKWKLCVQSLWGIFFFGEKENGSRPWEKMKTDNLKCKEKCSWKRIGKTKA